MHPYLLHNGEIRDTSAALLSPGQVGFLNGWGVFSTIRVTDGVLFAYERHWGRMQRDAELMRVPFLADSEELQAMLLRLVQANKAFDSTLRVAVVRNHGGLFEGPNLTRKFDIVAFTAPLNDWGSGVRLYLVPEGRHAGSKFAGAKITSWAQNLTWYEEAHERGFDEVLLLNERGEVSECTSANLFAAFGSEVRTPPLDSGCLPGITREVLLTEMHAPGIRVIEKALKPSDLEQADEVFITSTTRDLLPVVAIEGLRLRSQGGARAALASGFQEYRKSYVQSVKSAPTSAEMISAGRAS